MHEQRFVTTAPIGHTAIAILEKVAPVETAPKPDEETMMGMLEGTIGIVVRGEGKATARMIEAARELKVIGRTGVGYDSVDVEAATAHQVPLVYAPVGGFAVAEAALALLLALVKNVWHADQWVKNGHWNERYNHLSGDMADHTLGIVGLGRIGSQLAALIKPFGMTILGHDPVVDAKGAEAMGASWVELDELLASSDYVSLHMPLNDQTRGLINADRIARMKQGAILINTARGAVIESLDVVADALDSGQLAGVGLDVFPVEPPDVSHRVFQHPNLLCAPHFLGTSTLAMERIYASMALDMVAVIGKRVPKFCVNPEALA